MTIANLDRFDRFGYLLGLAFQITDDVLNLNGNVARYGKEINGDLWEGKRTLVLAHALGHANRDGPRLDQQFPGAAARAPACRARCCGSHQIIADGGSIAMGAAGGRRICRGRGARVRQARRSPACLRVPTSNGCAIASTISSGGTAE